MPANGSRLRGQIARHHAADTRRVDQVIKSAGVRTIIRMWNNYRPPFVTHEPSPQRILLRSAQPLGQQVVYRGADTLTHRDPLDQNVPTGSAEVVMGGLSGSFLIDYGVAHFHRSDDA